MSSSPTERATASQRERLPRSRVQGLGAVVCRRWPELWPLAPLVFAVVYTIAVLANFSSLITAINMDSDVSIALMIGKLVGSVWRTRSPVHWQTLAIAAQVAVVALVGGALLHHAMVAHGWTAFPLKISLVSASSLVHNLVVVLQSYTNLAGGDFFGAALNLGNAATLVSGLLFIAAFICVAAELYRRSRRSISAPVSLEPAAARRFAYTAFWGTSLAVTTSVVVLSNVPVDANSARYLLAGYVAVGALLPMLAMRSRAG